MEFGPDNFLTCLHQQGIIRWNFHVKLVWKEHSRDFHVKFFTWISREVYTWTISRKFHFTRISHEYRMKLHVKFTWGTIGCVCLGCMELLPISMDPMLGTVPRNKPRIQEVWPLWCNRRARNYIMFYRIYHPIVKVQVHQLYTSTSVYQQQN